MPSAGENETDFDDELVKVGLGVAARFDSHCGRRLVRVVDAVDDFTAWAVTWTLRGYPVENISSIEVVNPDGSTAAVSENDFAKKLRSGLMALSWMPGSAEDLVRFTYTGGYWLNDGGSQPAGSTALPDDLMEAYVAQVTTVCEARGVFTTGALQGESGLSSLGLLSDVKEVLRPYRRFGGI